MAMNPPVRRRSKINRGRKTKYGRQADRIVNNDQITATPDIIIIA
jgi:hypothetical protein